MGVYKDGRLLFLSDADVSEFDETATVPVIDNWNWTIAGDGKGCLLAPDGVKHCQFDLMSSSLQFEPGGEVIVAPGLSTELIQEMGEKYAYDVMFSDGEKKAYDDHVKMRDETKKAHNIAVRNTLNGILQKEYKDGNWLVHVDTKRVEELTGIESEHVISPEKGLQLFNRMSEVLHATPLADADGYMKLANNMYDFLYQEYETQYEDTLQAIDNQILDGTGYGISYVLDNLDRVVKQDILKFLPEGERLRNLRYVEATDERKSATRDFVKWRVSKTLTHEKKRSYEKSSIEKDNQKYLEAGERLRASLSDVTPAMAMES